MPMRGEVESASASVPGFDCNAVLSAELAQQFFSQGYRFCVRYIAHAQSSLNLSVEEATDILNSGLALMPVQHVRVPGWSPDQALGQQDGQEAVLIAQTIGFPAGVNVWCDLEGVNPAAQQQDVIAYCRAWHGVVRAAGFLPGLYVGAGALLTGRQLFDLPFQHYWRSSSSVPDIRIRGYQLVQFSPTIQLNGIPVDLDVALPDRRGDSARWLRAR